MNFHYDIFILNIIVLKYYKSMICYFLKKELNFQNN